MGIEHLLQHLPGGNTKLFSFSSLGLEREAAVPVDFAGALWQCADRHKEEYLNGDYEASLSRVAKILNNLRSMSKWKPEIYLDGRPNPHKKYEDERRGGNHNSAGDQLGDRRIKNQPEYIALCAHLCEFMQIKSIVAPYEADPQVVHRALFDSLIAVTGDSDLLAIGPSGNGHSLRRLVIVKSWECESFRVIDLEAPHSNGQLPLYDLYLEHGRIVFQLYAACSGCDFTKKRSGISGIGFAHFIELMNALDCPPSPGSLAPLLYGRYTKFCTDVGLETVEDVLDHLNRIVSIYADSEVYDSQANIIRFGGGITLPSNPELKLHMTGHSNPRNALPFCDQFKRYMNSIDMSQLLHKSAVNVGLLSGVHLPSNRAIQENNVTELRRFLAFRGGSGVGNKPELISHVISHQFLESQVPRSYVDADVDREGSMFIKVSTSSTKSVATIVTDIRMQYARIPDTKPSVVQKKRLINITFDLLSGGHFEADYNNISKVAPELKYALIKSTFGHVGSSETQKSIGGALTNCLYAKELHYHALAKVPESNRCVLLSKIEASMKLDDETRNQAADGSTVKKQYTVMQELLYEPTNFDEHSHNLGVFVKVLSGFCTGCTAGNGACRHQSEQLMFQYHHWTEDRLGIDAPPTISECGWRTGGRQLNSSMRLKIGEQQAVKYEKDIEAQAAKTARGVKRDCTEGQISEYSVYASAKKQRAHPLQFSPERCQALWAALAKQPNDEDETEIVGPPRPCRGQVRWYGATDQGLRDMRGYVHMWGLDCEIKRYYELQAMEEHAGKAPEEIGEMVLAERWDLKMRKELYSRHGKEYNSDL